MNTKRNVRHRFTLVELLVLIAMIAISTTNCIIANFSNLSN